MLIQPWGKHAKAAATKDTTGWVSCDPQHSNSSGKNDEKKNLMDAGKMWGSKMRD